MSTQNAVAIVRSRWHDQIVDRAVVGFTEEFRELRPGFIVDIYDVPGALEMPLMARRLAATGRYATVVAAAFVVDGGIYRHEFVAQAVIDGIMRAQFDTDVPILSVSLTPQAPQTFPGSDAFFADHFVTKGIEAARAADMLISVWADSETAEHNR